MQQVGADNDAVKQETRTLQQRILRLPACGSDDEATADPARFCEVNSEIEQLDDFSTVSPAGAEVLVGRTRELLAEAEQTSPAEIADEVRVTADAFREILDFYAEADFDVSNAEFETAILSGAVGSDPPEAETVFGWIDQNCSA